ncbi:hypothetical protein EUGRSUZ_L00551 [Eucalyptus grandis]|uniref:Uncharacterized protein n=1 Tax=Eucalyptus grandis TaxID=71139 RepID=A0A058ZV46_EUCGR|nr:hypothetical protein EUGRSUZ_L00551 [Eucalyptus grandis]
MGAARGRCFAGLGLRELHDMHGLKTLDSVELLQGSSLALQGQPNGRNSAAIDGRSTGHGQVARSSLN